MSGAIPVLAVLTGTVAALGPARSAIAKSPRPGPLFLGRDGLEGDQCGDTRVHGGTEKALHHYPLDHYEPWRRWHPPAAALPRPGAFGENVSTLGMTEAEVCVGDIYRLGKAVVQVSQPRQPCWKLNLRFSHPGFARWVQDSGWTGWYYRVLEEGAIAPGDAFVLVQRPPGAWSVARLLSAWYRTPLDARRLAAIATMPGLSENWRRNAARRLDSGAVEDWVPRLDTPAFARGQED